MTKDEIKNRISMALKDLVLQQGFEIICKENAKLKGEVDEQLAETQKRIEELEQQVEKMKCCDNCKHYLKALEMEILDLDKDELREPCNVCKDYNKWELRVRIK